MEISQKSPDSRFPLPGSIGRIGVLMGGPSSEREISFKSGKAVVEALQSQRVDTVSIDIHTDSIDENAARIKSYGIDCAFLALHGRFGEDGQIQGILESLRIPYTGSGVKASKLALDKVASCALFESHGIRVPRYKIFDKALGYDAAGLVQGLGFPLVIKPATGGSSIGLSIIDDEQHIRQALELAFSYDDKVIVEVYIKGRELTVGILDARPLPVIEIIPKKRFFDYEAKYKAGMTEYIVPANLEAPVSKKVQDMALAAHTLLGCWGCSRADFILSEGGVPYILEVNTIPGFTQTSLLPKAAKVTGIEFPQLCLRLIELAYEKAQLESGHARD